MSATILIVEDEDTLRESLRRVFEREGYAVDVASTAEQALELYDETIHDVILADIILPEMDGLEMLSLIKKRAPEQIFILMTAYASVETAIRALREGAYDYIMKPIIHEEIKRVVRNALYQRGLTRENIRLKKEVQRVYDIGGIVGKSSEINAVIEQVKKVAPTNSTVLFLGETGTGKELFARALHQLSPRSEGPFVAINCSSIPEHLLESELFGHTRGAFTGAVAPKKGLLEEADGGTVFLDEIGDMPVHIQAKLLRVIEDREVRPLGSTKAKTVDLRFVLATHRNLPELVKEGKFREDLYYRINVLTIDIPPLRQRKDDIEPLVEHFIRKYAEEFGKSITGISPEARALLLNYHWPGNVRELKNVVERAVLLCEGSIIQPEHLPENMKERGSFVEDALSKGLSIEEYTKAFIMKYQDIYTEQELADKLGITRKTLWEKRKKWGIKRK
ncbi:MAG: sigma-54-dependent Fis family transcriptional regulator, partial [Nitrospirae bacterium]